MSGDTPNREEWLDEVLEEVFAFGGLPKYQRLAEAKAQILAHYAPKPPVTPDTSDGELEYIHSLIHQPEYAVVYPETETEDGNYEVSKRIQEYVHQQRVEAYEQAIQDVKKQGYGYDDGSGFVLKISFSELARLTKDKGVE